MGERSLTVQATVADWGHHLIEGISMPYRLRVQGRVINAWHFRPDRATSSATPSLCTQHSILEENERPETGGGIKFALPLLARILSF